MAIVARSLEEATRTFCDHLNHLFATTLVPARLRHVKAYGCRQVAFAGTNGLPQLALLHSQKYGNFYLYVGQVVRSRVIEEGQHAGLHRLYTDSYRYAIMSAPDAEPTLRWEYCRDWPSDETWCRHHLQGTPAIPFAASEINLKKCHLPTGYVPIEEVIRFCIDDLGVRPATDKWHANLEKSYNTFLSDFVVDDQ